MIVQAPEPTVEQSLQLADRVDRRVRLGRLGDLDRYQLIQGLRFVLDQVRRSGIVGATDFAPTQGMQDVFADLSRRVDAQIARWNAIAAIDVPAFDRLVRSAGVPLVGAGGAKRRAASRPPRKAARRRVRRS